MPIAQVPELRHPATTDEDAYCGDATVYQSKRKGAELHNI
jgi:hypothetical protein